MNDEDFKWVSCFKRFPATEGKYKIRAGEDRHFDCSDIHKQIWYEAGVEWYDETLEKEENGEQIKKSIKELKIFAISGQHFELAVIIRDLELQLKIQKVI